MQMNLNYVKLYCPTCRARLLDVSIGTPIELKVIEEGDCWKADFCTKCRMCKAKIGIRKRDQRI